MSKNTAKISRHSYLHRKILNAYWLVILISIIAEFAALFITIQQYPAYINYYLVNIMLIPTALLVFLMCINEYLERVKKIENPYILILNGTFIASVLIAVNPLVHGLQYMLLLPLLISLLYFQRGKLIFAFIMNFISLIILYSFLPILRANTTLYEAFASVFIMFGALAVELEIVKRGMNLLDDLKRTIQSEQELLIRTVIMDKLVKTDALTELYNHKTFHEYLDKLVEQSESNHLPLQLAIIDIDNFKKINDTFGHAIGDVILKRVAAIINESVTSEEIVARYGGEEFAVIFTGSTLEQAFQKTERIRESISNMHHMEMEGKQVTVSIGLADYKKGSNKSDLFVNSDSLLYLAKNSGKNKTVADPLLG
ncbi:MAG: hypothetical protein JWM44_512 [Bacilli bacterium]|nr:hypothetical protein [Bacilli bacterium]